MPRATGSLYCRLAFVNTVHFAMCCFLCIHLDFVGLVPAWDMLWCCRMMLWHPLACVGCGQFHSQHTRGIQDIASSADPSFNGGESHARACFRSVMFTLLLCLAHPVQILQNALTLDEDAAGESLQSLLEV